MGCSVRGSESPHVSQRDSSVAPESKHRGGRKEKEVEILAGGPLPAPEPAKKERKKRSTKRTREESMRAETPKPPYGDRMQGSQLQPLKVSSYTPTKANELPEPTSSNASSSNHRSVQPSPIHPIQTVPSRVVDEDYDEGVADSLLNLRHATMSGPAVSGSTKMSSPTPSRTSHHSHRGSISSTRPQHTPPSAGSKRLLSPASDETDNKRTKMDIFRHVVNYYLQTSVSFLMYLVCTISRSLIAQY